MRSVVFENRPVGPVSRVASWMRSDKVRASMLGAAGCALAGAVAAIGPTSIPALSLLAIGPLEAAFSGSRKALLWASAASLTLVGAAFVAMPFIGLEIASGIDFTTSTIVGGAVYFALLAKRLISRQDANSARERALVERSNVLADFAEEIVIRIDRTGHANFVSKASVKLSGHEPTRLNGAGLLEAMHVQDRVVFLKAISDCVASRASLSTKARIRVRGQGDVLWREFAISLYPPLKSRELVSVWRDNTTVAGLESRLAEMDVSVADREEIQARNFAQMSHELRTPLNAIGGFSQLLVSGVAGPLATPKQREYVSLIQQSSDHLLQIVGDLLDVSRMDQGHFDLEIEGFNFVEMAKSTTAMMQAEAISADVDLVCDMPANLAPVFGDRRACQQILINLLSNAIKFSPEGSSVRLSARRHGRFVKIRCIDTGIGMTEEFLEQIGRPFTQAQPASKGGPTGSGLGLSVVKGLVELHGGQIEFDSKPDSGTTVTVMLPFRSASAKPVPANTTDRLVRIDAPRVSPVTNQNDVCASDAENPKHEKQTQGESSARVSA